MSYLQIAIGFICLLGGAEILVRGAVQVAQKLGLSSLLIGMTVVAFGTSAPEFVVSLDAALSGAPGMALGNVVGSNIANVLLILGATALVAPVLADPKAVMRDGLMLMGGSILFTWLSLTGRIGMPSGVLLVGALFGYFLYSYLRERRNGSAAAKLHEREAEEFEDMPEVNVWLSWVLLIAGLAGVMFGADQLVTGGTSVARDFGVPDEVIGLTLIAFGTSLPELAASMVAALRGHTDVAIGNVVGSNLFNLMGVAGGVAIVTPLTVPSQIQSFDVWVMMAATLLVFVYLVQGRRLHRREGLVFLAAYGLYIGVQSYGVSGVMDLVL